MEVTIKKDFFIEMDVLYLDKNHEFNKVDVKIPVLQLTHENLILSDKEFEIFTDDYKFKIKNPVDIRAFYMFVEGGCKELGFYGRQKFHNNVIKVDLECDSMFAEGEIRFDNLIDVIVDIMYYIGNIERETY